MSPSTTSQPGTKQSLAGRPGDRVRAQRAEKVFAFLCLSAVVLPLLSLAVLLGALLFQGLSRIDLAFLQGYPSRHWEEAGVLPGLVGSLLLVAITAAIAVPVGVGAAIFLEEYAREGRSVWTSRLAVFIEINIANLAGVPSVIYGLLGLELFVRLFGMERSVLAGGCTLALLVLPVVITATREALRTVPETLREGAYALGATPWQVVRQVVLPMALPGILTGAILSVSRAMGESAPLIVVGALAFITFLPDSPTSPFTALPIQIFNWVSRPQAGFITNAAAAIVVLLVLLVVMNAGAIILRNRLSRRVTW